MTTDLFRGIAAWDSLDWWIVATGALAAMACAVPGCFLVVRKQSLMGDAISHAALPGVVLAFLLAQMLRHHGWLEGATYEVTRHLILFAGAVVVGVLCAVGTELVQKTGHVEASAALGVVFTTLFALGLLLIRLVADDVDIDPDCVLYGTLENVVLDVLPWGGVPRAAAVNGIVCVANLAVVLVLFKELKISAFDPSLATALGIRAPLLHHLLMAVTAVTLVAAFESVGSILVIAMLIVPAATAYLLTDRLSIMLLLSLLVAALSAFLGHLLALVLPPLIFHPLGYPDVVDASTAGMMAVAAGGMFLLALVVSPRYGLVTRLLHRRSLAGRVAREDVLGLLYRLEERRAAGTASVPTVRAIAVALGQSVWTTGWALAALRRRCWVRRTADGWQLLPAGREAGRRLVRSHRLWESFLASHFPDQEATLHESAERVEHFIDERLRGQLDRELNSPLRDPHGAAIPAESADGAAGRGAPAD